MHKSNNKKFNPDSPDAQKIKDNILLLLNEDVDETNKNEIILSICSNYSIDYLRRYRKSLTGAYLIHIFNHDYDECKKYEHKYRQIADLLISTKQNTLFEERKNKQLAKEATIEAQNNELFETFLPIVKEIAEAQYYLAHNSSSNQDDEIIKKYVQGKNELYILAKGKPKKYKQFVNAIHNLKYNVSVLPNIKINSTTELGELQKSVISAIDETYSSLFKNSGNKIVPQKNKTGFVLEKPDFEENVSWMNVCFEDGIIRVKAKNTYYRIPNPLAKVQYNLILRLFSQRLGDIRIKVSNGKAQLLDEVRYERVVLLLELIDNVNKEGGHNALHESGLKLLNVPPAEIRIIFPINKTPYFDYLQEIQLENSPIVPCFEDNHLRVPDGFLFTIHCESGICVIWESCNSISRKSTYVFIKPDNYNISEFQTTIFQYVSSPLKRKRELLRNYTTVYFKNIRYFSVDHDGFQNWSNELETILNQKTRKEIKSGRKGVESKNEGAIDYSIMSKNVSYERTHNLMQNQLKKVLWNKGVYTKIELEKDYIDLIATRSDGSVEYYEIKTYDTPKKCIREGLGQLLEYVYYFDKPIPRKLIIVGPKTLNEQDKKYIARLRNELSISLSYQQFKST